LRRRRPALCLLLSEQLTLAVHRTPVGVLAVPDLSAGVARVGQDRRHRRDHPCLAAAVTGTGAADQLPAVAITGTTLHLAFARRAYGVYTTAKAATTGWAAPVRRSTSSADSSPNVAVDSQTKVYLMYDRG